MNKSLDLFFEQKCKAIELIKPLNVIGDPSPGYGKPHELVEKGGNFMSSDMAQMQ